VTTTTGCWSDTTNERPRFFPRQLIGADDLNRQQDYHRQKLREHNRLLHGWGVVCGCGVEAAPTTERPGQIRITPGYLLTPQGDSVLIRADVLFDVATCAVDSDDRCAFARPCPQPTRRRVGDQRQVYLAVRYIECDARPVRVAPGGCSCDDAECEYSRVVEAYELTCLDELPRTHAPLEPDCEPSSLRSRYGDCPQCPDDPWVVLASMVVIESDRFHVGKIIPSGRRFLPSVGMLGDHVHCMDSRNR
jgi:hypothetical protein